MSSRTDDDGVRDQIASLLQGGLKTEVWPRAESSEDVVALVQRLHGVKGDLQGKLVVAGFTDHVITADGLEQPCETCMYYLVNRRFCVLPELMLPVEADWSCRLWRI